MTLLHQAAQKAVEALKPCPFCGGKATVDVQFGREWWVECDDCAASTGGMGATRAAAMVAWNRRAESALQQQPEPVAKDAMEAHAANGLAWAVSCWRDEVSQRPLVNVHRRTLDDTWRQVIRYFGGDPDKLIGPNHDTLHMRAQEERAWKP